MPRTPSPAEVNGAKGPLASAPPAETGGDSIGRQGVRPLSATFRRILVVVLVIFAFAVVQMLTLWAVCNVGMRTASSLEYKGLPTLSVLASLQENLVTYRLVSYEYLFATEAEKPGKAKAVAALASQIRGELATIKTLFPEGEGQHLASGLGDAIDDLDKEFQEIRGLVDTDFVAAMTAMDREIPQRTERVAAAANALKQYGYNFSGSQAEATFGSFGWIKKNAIAFGAGNILVALGAVVFVRVAAQRSHAQLSHTLARLDERTVELAGSLSLVHATLESTVDGILVVDRTGKFTTFNRRFAEMWRIAPDALASGDRDHVVRSVMSQLKDPEGFVRNVRETYANPEAKTFDTLEFEDGRVFERYTQPQLINGAIVGRVSSFRDVTERKVAEVRLAETHRQLVDASRQAGMAEVAIDVLHNVGNVLNSVNVSAILVADRVRQSKALNVAKLAAMLDEHKAHLVEFLTKDDRGRMIPGYLGTLATSLSAEHEVILGELSDLGKNIEHIKDIVATQQLYARSSGATEAYPVVEMIEEALRISSDSLARHHVDIIRDYQVRPVIMTDKHKIVQILVNLVINAKFACVESGRADKRVTVRTTGEGIGLRILVIDNGVGIPAENLNRIFNHGFTTRKGGHGFGLHSGALVAKELGGALLAQSDGRGRGATFVLELPCNPSPPLS
jgi:PAS domain S-box-containing protein